jgi:hypothetical protein
MRLDFFPFEIMSGPGWWFPVRKRRGGLVFQACVEESGVIGI